MNTEISSSVMHAGAPVRSHGGDAIAGTAGTTERGPDLKPPHSTIERLAAVSSDQMYIARFVSTLLFRLQDLVLHNVYSPKPPGHSRLLNLGCGDIQFDGWVNADRMRVAYLMLNAGKVLRGKLKLPEWVIDAASSWNCADDYWEGIFTEDVLEHLSYNKGVVALREALRTLQPGAWIRILLPDLQRYVEFCNGKTEGRPTNAWFDEQFEYCAEAIAYLTQNQGHASVWEPRLLSAALSELGFVNIAVVSYGCGSDPRLIKDSASRRHENLYVEAQKPGAMP